MLSVTAFFMVLLSGLTYQQEITLECPSGWSHYGSHCYKLVEQPMGFDDAARVCYNYGSSLARIFGFEENAEVAQIVRSVNSSVTQYWIGFTRQYLDDPSDTTDTSAHWMGMEMEKMEASTSEGFWAPDQPAPAEGNCGMVEYTTMRYYPFAWKMSECLAPHPFVCEAPAGIPESYRCANGKYIRDSMELICDDADDCGDYSDEFNCASDCRTYLTGTEGTVNTPGTYGTNMDCRWTLEAPVGQRIMLRFTEFNTEKDIDIVEVFIGGPTISKSSLLARLSGNQNIGEMPMYYSDNNYMIVKFRTDSSVQMPGFTFEWNTEPQFPGPMTKLDAQEDMAQYITSPSYGFRVGAAVRESWVISVPLERRVISLQVVDLDLPDCAFINVYDGEDFSAPMLDYISNLHNPQTVISTGNTVHVFYHSCEREYTEYTGFNLSYVVGCHGMVLDFANYLISPGYYAGRNYPNYQTCSWLILSPHSPTKIKMIFRSPFGLQDGVDTLTIYNGLDDSGTPVGTFTGTSDPGSFISQEGHFFLVLTTSSIINARGFLLEYSETCPPPPFNEFTNYPIPLGRDIDDESLITCDPGTEFAQEEHYGKPSVTLVGKLGFWSVAQTPNCERVWCEQAPQIENGYYVNSTGSQYGDTVTYSCYAGFTINPYDTITCMANGNWQPAPTCSATRCPQLDNTIINGEVSISNADDRVYGTVFTYECNDGFELKGIRKIVCQGDETWSDEVPTCERVRCPVEMLDEVFSEHGTLTPNSNVLFEDTVNAVCDEGFQLVKAEDIFITCLANQSFNSMPECIDIDECIPNDGFGPCDLQCINTEGTFSCTCDEGYTLADDGFTCEDLDECEEGEMGWTYCNQQCVNFDGGYRCECQSSGHFLYTQNGTEGFYLKNNENGLIPGDVLFLNHTCARNLCPEIPPLANGRVLTYQDSFNFGNEVYFHCDLGYVLTGGEKTQCEGNRQWSVDPSTITCEFATCEIPDVSGLEFPPSFEPVSGSVSYLATVEVTCTHFRPTPLVFQRMCLYDQSQDIYSLYLKGASVECPVIDCDNPILPSGAEVVGSITETKYGSTFTIRCQDLFQQEGDTNLGSGVVTCNETGKWDFGTFHCNGATCTDPGTEAGTIQNSPTTYEPGETVTYECIQDGFALNGPSTLECAIVDSIPKWNGDPPTCSDVRNPLIRHNDCGATIEIERLQPHNIQRPTVTDNTGATEDSGILLTLNDENGELAQLIAIAEPKTLTYTATDFEGNEDTCNIQVNLKDYVAPVITCPESYAVFIATEESTAYEIPTQGKQVTATDNIGQPTITYSPESVTLNSSIINTWVIISATATDDSGNEASCQYMIYVQPKVCTSFSMRDPVNGQTNCAVFGDGFRCTVICNDGYYFYDLSDETGMVNEQMYECTGSGNFQVTDVHDCVLPKRSEFFIGFELEYEANEGSDSAGCLREYTSDLNSAAVDVAGYLQSTCRNEIGSADATVTSVERDYEFRYESDTKKLFANIYFKLGPPTLSELDRERCRDLFERHFAEFPDDSFANIQTIASTESCPQLTHQTDTVDAIDLDPNTDSMGENLCATSNPPLVKEARISDDPDNIEYYCFPCPPGTFYDNGVCTACPIGQYQPDSGSTECIDCPSLTSTFETGSPTRDHCVATCETQPGFASANNLPPCPVCGKNTYSKYEGGNSTCELCPVGKATDGTGSTKQDDCKDPCDPGYYSDTGYQECIFCPQHFYQPSSGQTTCLECASDEITEENIPYTSSSDCLDGVTNLCGPDVCQNGGTCSVSNHHVMCACVAGYTGVYCETMIDFCTSNPCYYNGQCSPVEGGFTCACPPGGYTGDRCETPPDFCDGAGCENGGMCKNTGTTFECLCPTGYQGTLCQNTEDICESDPCGDRGNCERVTARRRICNCDAGWTGETCETNIDDCASNPCLYGFGCVDGDNDYTCDCTGDYAGKNCEIRPADVCGSDPCQNTGVCFDDYRDNGFVCICNEGYDGSTSAALGTWLETITGSAKLMINGACDLINYCIGSTNKCVDEGTQQCTSTTSGPYCTCKTGFSGSNCQHNIDDCANDPCVNGKCIDGDNMYNCSCDFGYTGINCELDIEDCVLQDYPCDINGTDTTQGDNGCLDKVGDYQCFCKPGYRGKNCEIEINECMTFPCKHGGQCDDLVNDFVCSCPEAWEGKRCEIPSQYCDNGTCENDAECISLFGDYFCQCDYPYYGERCELEASTCRDANPCVDEESECFENDEGKAVCECSDDFVGEGCQLRKNHCADENFCLNGGTCRRSMELDKFECVCIPGYTGRRCGERLQNICDTVSCENSGECIVNGDDFICRCPIGMDGPSCDKVRDTNWDICFDDSDNMGMAYKSYAIPLGSELEEFSLGMWVKYTENKGDGVFFTLYGVEYQSVNAPRKKLIQIDSQQAHLYFSRVTESVSRDFGLYDINDRSWYYVMITWVKATGKLQLYVNSYKVHVIENYAKDEDLPEYAMIFLGSVLEDEDASELVPEEDSGFHGCVSHIFGWNKELQFDGQVPAMADSRLNLVLQGDLILDWKSYLTGYGAYITSPSTAGDNVCEEGFTGNECNILLPDKEGPTVDDCPEVVHKTHGDSRITQVTWEEPEFEGHFGQPRSIYRNGAVFTWGKYHNIYVAEDPAGNTAVCTFDIYVRRDDCEAPEDPSGGASSCSDIQGDSSWPFRTCEASCDSGTFSIPKPAFYTCGPQGNFPTDHMFLNRFVYPSCAVSTPQLVLMRVIITFLNIRACDDLIVVAGFKTPLMIRVKALNDLWHNIGTTVGAFCNGEVCEEVIKISTVCKPLSQRRRRKRQSELSNAEVTIVIPSMQDPIESSNSVRSPAEVLTSDILDNMGFNLDDSISGAVVDEPTLIVSVEPICMKGQVLIGSSCVDCGPGTYYDNSTRTCLECPVGEYQDMVGQERCKMCLPGETTEAVGSQGMEDCHEICPAGSYFDLDMDSCQFCDVGFYQDMAGAFFCWPCDADETTPGNASVSEASCYEYCPDGTELTDLGECTDCEIGYYRTSGLQARCTPCETGFVTSQPRSVSAAECTIPDCQEGEKIVGSGCEPCPIAFFQNEKWQPDCIECPTNQTTLQTGSVDPDQCLFFCPMGQEEHMDVTLTCQLCDQGFYKDNSLPGEMCQPCPDDDFVTPGLGSTSDANCTVLSCNPGDKASENRSECVPCEIGSYQPEPYKDMCIPCRNGTSTREEGADQMEDCEEYCPAGTEMDDPDSCVPCPIGYFRHVNDVNKFTMCEQCHEDFITASEGATEEIACNIANCTAGQYRNNETNVCHLCPKGQYQPNWWQEACIPCDPDGHKTTDGMGATSEDQCRLECQSGYEDPGTNACQKCAIGYYKAGVGVAPCTICENGMITEEEGASSASDCDVVNCTAGTYRDTDDNVCVPCPRGTFEDRKWQENECQMCTGSLTTIGVGADESTDCITNCLSGSGYDLDQERCLPCPRGYYRTQDMDDLCTKCDEDFITLNTGAFSSADCNIRNCSAGTFRSSTNVCEPCPQGEYQPNKWTTSCIECPSGQTTSNTGSITQSDCIRDCPLGEGYNTLTGSCETCARGTYRDATKLTCQDCDPGTTTIQSGSVSKDDCSISECSVGRYAVGFTCLLCSEGTYEDRVGSVECKPCPGDPQKVTSPSGSTSSEQCQSTDECALGTHQCLSTNQGGLCEDLPNVGFRCVCRPGWEGTHPNCTHKCDLDYCKNGGQCVGAGTASVSCDCSDVDFEGDQCETETKEVSYTNAIIGGAVGGGVGLILIILIVVCCCFAFRGSEAAPAKMPPPAMSMGPSPFVYNSMPTGVILKQNTNQSAGSLYYPGDGQSLTGYPGNTGNPGSRYMFYEETDNGAVNTLGRGATNNTFTSGTVNFEDDV